MQALFAFIGLFFTVMSFAQETAEQITEQIVEPIVEKTVQVAEPIVEKTVQVGKHVSPSTDAATMILSLLIVLLVVIVSAYILKKFQITAQGGQQALKVVSSVHLGSKERVVVVQVGEKQLVLGVTANQVNLLDTLDTPLDTGKTTSEMFNKPVFNMIKNRLKKND